MSSVASAIGDRDENQDAYWYSEPISPHGELVFAVADGMGGGQFGAWAAQSAIQVIVNALHTAPVPAAASVSPSDRLRAAIAQANAVVHAAYTGQADELGNAPMGCAIAVCLLNQHTLTIAHVGDVRVYLWRRGHLAALTRDHSWAVAMGESTDAGRVMRHVLLRAVGPSPQVEPDVKDHPIEPGDVIVVCTDGVWAALPEAQMAQLIARTSSKSLADQLVQAAHERDAGDNATALTIALRVDDSVVKGKAVALAAVALLIMFTVLVVLSTGHLGHLFGGSRLPLAQGSELSTAPLPTNLPQATAMPGDATTPATGETPSATLLPQPTTTLAVPPTIFVCSDNEFNNSQSRCPYSVNTMRRPQAIYVSWDPSSAELRSLETLSKASTKGKPQRVTPEQKKSGYIRLEPRAFGTFRSRATYGVRLYFAGLVQPAESWFEVAP
ncbi:MAG: protein phosphatase 2C domain-containing protein [Anaerolineales bacterium]|nr:protein phosphatase 2C domain-containing protein [Anaerolineales bacterium]